jgi:uncharacterized protein (TIGR01777 family)
MKIVIPGGSGHLGTLLARQFHRRGDQVVVLSRAPHASRWRTVAWDGCTPGDWTREIDGADVVINLAGRSVHCRYTREHRAAILDSRVLSTHAVGAAIARSKRPPRLWIQASTATIYAHRYDAPNDEYTGIVGGGEPSWEFSVDVARAWEREVDLASTLTTRAIKLRTAVVMSPDRGSAFDLLLRVVRAGLGGRAGDGKQFVSWIHHLDFVRAIEWIIEDEDLAGIVNVAAPNPLTNEEFMCAIREGWGSSVGIPAPRWLLELGAVLIRSETELLLKSRRVVPRKLIDHGFEFRFPAWAEAARDLVDEWREQHDLPLRPHLLVNQSRF